MSNILYAYGTLRTGQGEQVQVNGTMRDLGWFPGVKLGGPGTFLCEKVEIADWAAADRFEGYDESDPEMSLYIRRPYADGFIYEFNKDFPAAARVVQSGDWLDYRQEKRGTYANRF